MFISNRQKDVIKLVQNGAKICTHPDITGADIIDGEFNYHHVNSLVIKKLVAKGLIERGAKGYRLTEAGREIRVYRNNEVRRKIVKLYKELKAGDSITLPEAEGKRTYDLLRHLSKLYTNTKKYSYRTVGTEVVITRKK